MSAQTFVRMDLNSTGNVSGVPLLEESSEKRYGNRQDYRDYKRKTNKYFLWFPKKIQENSR